MNIRLTRVLVTLVSLTATELPPAAADDSCETVCDCVTWTFSADAVFLDRATPDSLALMQATEDPSQQLNASDFDFDWQAGWQFSAMRTDACGRVSEFRYFGIDGWQADTTQSVNTTLLDPLRINTDPPVFAPNVAMIDANYGSDLHNVEVNIHEPLAGRLSLLGGFRFVALDDTLRATLHADPQTFIYRTATRNRLYGYQLGATIRSLCVGDFEIDAAVKAGVFYNDAEHSSTLDTGAAVVSAAADRDTAAFLGEVSIGGRYKVTECLAVRAGYNLVWMESVAVATAQIPSTNLIAGNGIDDGGGVFFHGATVGIEWRR